MSTIRATYVQHGSSSVPNITLNASGQVVVASGIVSSGTFAAPSGSAAAPGVYFDGDTDTGLYSPGANQVALSTSGTGRLFVNSAGLVGIGTSSVSGILDAQTTGNTYVNISSTDPGSAAAGVTLLAAPTGEEFIAYKNHLRFGTVTGKNGAGWSERARIDSSGRLLVGTPSARSTATLATGDQVFIEKAGNYAGLGLFANANSTLGSYIALGKSRGTTAGSVTVVQNNDVLGYIGFEGTDGTASRIAASIQTQVDGTPAGPTPGPSSMPGRLVFSTTADGASSPSERARITSGGKLLIGRTDSSHSAQFALPAHLTTSIYKSYTTSTTPTGILTISQAGNSVFEITVSRTDSTSPAGASVHKLYVVTIGSGINITNATLVQEDKASIGSIGNLTFSIATASNQSTISVVCGTSGQAQSLYFKCDHTSGYIA